MTNNIHRFDFWHSWMINTETQKTVEILWYPTTHAVCATMSVLEKVLFDLVWYYVPNFWNGWNCWEEKINHCGHSLNMRREFENFQPCRDWNPFEINELWLRRTYLRFPFHKYFPKIPFLFTLYLQPTSFWFQFQEYFLEFLYYSPALPPLSIFFLCFFFLIFFRNIFSFVFTLSLQSWSSWMSEQYLRDLFLQHQPFHTKSSELNWT